MIGRGKCDWCKNRLDENVNPLNPYEFKCKAFPNGIPIKKYAYITIDSCIDCNNGIGFEPNEEQNKD